MQEAEVAEAYRERFLREARAIQPLVDEGDNPTEPWVLPLDVEARIHRGFTPNELAIWREETGESQPPGWMSVVVFPIPAQPGILNPVSDSQRFQTTIQIPDRWDTDHWPLQYFDVRPKSQGLFARLPDRDDVAPAYLVSMYRDGVMEYGTTLAPALRHEDPTRTGSSSAKVILLKLTTICKRSPWLSDSFATKAL